MEPRGISSTGDGGSEVAGATAVRVTVNAADGIAIVADSDTNYLYVYQVSATAIQRLGWMEPPQDSNGRVQLAAMDPVDGRIVAVGTDYSTVQFYARTGAVLQYVSEIDLTGTSRDAYALQFQP
jgi:hypothetical protein